jgi:hypothetical protein
VEKSVTLSASIDFWTHYRASRAVANRTWNNYLGWGFFFGIPLVLFAVMLYLRQDVSTPGLFGLPAWALPIIGFLFMTVLMPLVHALKIRSHRKRNRSAGSLQTYTITPEAYSLSDSLFDTTLKREAFLKARETKQFFLLYISSRWAHFIPKAAISSGSDLRRIRSIIREKLGSRTHLSAET